MDKKKMKRLAIISSYNEKCGNASYTHVLKNAFSQYYDVEVISLDLFVLQKTSRRARKLGDEHIDAIAKRLADFDCVNIQFEAGLYGSIVDDMYNRAAKLIRASRNLLFTMHRIDLPSKSAKGKIWNAVKSRKFNQIYDSYRTSQLEKLYENLALVCDSEAKKKNVWIAVHTKRERRIVQEYFKVQNCFDHPLAYLTEQERVDAWNETDRQGFLQTYGLPPDSKVLGLFGYISSYKGTETAILALNELPSNYVLAIFGSQHPQSLRLGVAVDPYLQKLFELIGIESTKFDKKAAKKIDPQTKNLDKSDKAASIAVLEATISERVRFIGNVDDPAFIKALRLCDAVILPYLEVGQSMSGVIALATECGAKMYCANNASFAEVQKYYGPVFHNFDVGNHFELAQKLKLGGSTFKTERDAVYDKYNISTLVDLFVDKFGHGNQ